MGNCCWSMVQPEVRLRGGMLTCLTTHPCCTNRRSLKGQGLRCLRQAALRECTTLLPRCFPVARSGFLEATPTIRTRMWTSSQLRLESRLSLLLTWIPILTCLGHTFSRMLLRKGWYMVLPLRLVSQWKMELGWLRTILRCPCIPHPSPLMDSPWDKGSCFLRFTSWSQNLKALTGSEWRLLLPMWLLLLATTCYLLFTVACLARECGSTYNRPKQYLLDYYDEIFLSINVWKGNKH